jgi:hypothetical protein
MHDQPEPTEEEQEQTPGRLEEEGAMRGTGHDHPDGVEQEESEE